MNVKITKEDRIKAQQLLREVLLILSDANDVEERLSHVREESTKLYKRLDDMADGENNR